MEAQERRSKNFFCIPERKEQRENEFPQKPTKPRSPRGVTAGKTAGMINVLIESDHNGHLQVLLHVNGCLSLCLDHEECLTD